MAFDKTSSDNIIYYNGPTIEPNIIIGTYIIWQSHWYFILLLFNYETINITKHITFPNTMYIVNCSSDHILATELLARDSNAREVYF